MTGAACGHTGAGGSGAGPLGPTEITWTMVHASGIPSAFFQLGTDPNDEYYVVTGAGDVRPPGDQPT